MDEKEIKKIAILAIKEEAKQKPKNLTKRIESEENTGRSNNNKHG